MFHRRVRREGNIIARRPIRTRQGIGIRKAQGVEALPELLVVLAINTGPRFNRYLVHIADESRRQGSHNWRSPSAKIGLLVAPFKTTCPDPLKAVPLPIKVPFAPPTESEAVVPELSLKL